VQLLSGHSTSALCRRLSSRKSAGHSNDADAL
jgi:hypothetical protein